MYKVYKIGKDSNTLITASNQEYSYQLEYIRNMCQIGLTLMAWGIFRGGRTCPTLGCF